MARLEERVRAMVTGADGDINAVMVMIAHEFRANPTQLFSAWEELGASGSLERRRVPERVVSALEVVHDAVVALGAPDSDRYQGRMTVARGIVDLVARAVTDYHRSSQSHP
jgi:hypothetical protein